MERYNSSGIVLEKYHYITNVQGDVIRLIDDNNEVVANYTYDAWGKLISITDAGGSAITASNHIAIRNPIRYRGYIYDEDTKMYYCNSRYYDPQTRRFINADGAVSTGQGFIGFNMYAYSGNNPVMYSDASGKWFLGDVWSFIKDACVETVKAIQGLAPAYAGGLEVAAADGPLPFGDIICVGLTVALTLEAVGEGIYNAATLPKNYVKDEVKVEEKEKTIPAPIENAVYYGADILGGTWKTVTEPMNFPEARLWVEATAEAHIYGRGASWGLYTPNEIDAKIMAIALGGANYVFDPAQSGIYAHYHVEGRNLFGRYKHFHIWFGSLG